MSELIGANPATKPETPASRRRAKELPDAAVEEFDRLLGGDGGQRDSNAFVAIDVTDISVSATAGEIPLVSPHPTMQLQMLLRQQGLNGISKDDRRIGVKYVMTSFANGIFARNAAVGTMPVLPDADGKRGPPGPILSSAMAQVIHDVSANDIDIATRAQRPAASGFIASSQQIAADTVSSSSSSREAAMMSEYKSPRKQMRIFSEVDGARIYIRDSDLVAEDVEQLITPSKNLFGNSSVAKVLWLNGKKII